MRSFSWGARDPRRDGPRSSRAKGWVRFHSRVKCSQTAAPPPRAIRFRAKPLCAAVKITFFTTCYYTRMPRWLDALEQRFHFLVIPQFPLFIATANGLIYLMSQAQPVFVERLVLDPAAIRAGQWWRAVTFLFVPPPMNPFFLVFWLLLIYQFAQALENAWGEFRFFAFYLIGAAATVAAALLVLHEPLGNVSLNTTLFLAFATLYPDFELLLFFFIPIKVKYMAYF